MELNSTNSSQYQATHPGRRGKLAGVRRVLPGPSLAWAGDRVTAWLGQRKVEDADTIGPRVSYAGDAERQDEIEAARPRHAQRARMIGSDCERCAHSCRPCGRLPPPRPAIPHPTERQPRPPAIPPALPPTVRGDDRSRDSFGRPADGRDPGAGAGLVQESERFVRAGDDPATTRSFGELGESCD